MATSPSKQLPNNASQAKDANHIAIATASQFQSLDATGTPITSPVTVTNAVKTIVAPSNAVEMVIWSGTNLVRVSEDSAIAQYSVPPANIPVSYPIAKQQNIYLFRDGGSDATVQFFFKTL